MRKWMFAALVLCAPSLAQADGPAGQYSPARPAVWTGFYFGVNGGYGWGDNGAQFSGDNPDGQGAGNYLINTLAGSSSPQPPAQLGRTLKTDGWFGGGQLGYNRQIGRTFVAGVELDIQKSWVDGDDTIKSAAPFFTLTTQQKLDWFSTARARLGVVAHERFLVFVSGGLAFGKTDVSSKISLPAGAVFNVTTVFS